MRDPRPDRTREHGPRSTATHRPFEEALQGLGSLHGSIAKKAFADGATLRCDTCGRTEGATTEQCAGYLARGWPLCCELTMTIVGPADKDSP